MPVNNLTNQLTPDQARHQTAVATAEKTYPGHGSLLYLRIVRALKQLILAGLVMPISACDAPQVHEQKYLSQARTYLAQSNLEKARIELKNTLQINPNSAEAHLLMGEIEEQRQEWRKAYNHYHKARELKPDLIEPYVRLGNYYLLQAASLKSQGKSAEERGAFDKLSQQVKTALQINNEDVDALLLQASMLAYSEDIKGAESLLLEIIRRHKHSEDSYMALAQLHIKSGEYQQAAETLKQGLQSLAGSTQMKTELARTYRQLGQIDKAIDIMQRLVEEQPEEINYTLSLAAYYLQNEKVDDAEKAIRNSLSHSADDIDRHLILADFLANNRSESDAVNFLEETIAKYPDEAELQFKLASLHSNSKADTSIDLLNGIIEKWQELPESIRAKKILASLYYKQGKYSKSSDIVKQVLDKNPLDSEALAILGKTAFKQKDYTTAITSFRSALKTQPDSLETIQLLADAYLLNGELELANETLKSAIGISPRSLSGRLQLARFNLANKMPDEALQQVNTILSQDEDHIAAIKLKSEILMTLNRHDELPALFERLKVLAPQSPEGWFRMGRFYLLKNQPLQARQELETAWVKAPQALDLLAELTDLEISLGKSDKAKSRLKRLLADNPVHPEAHKFLGMIYLVEDDYEQAEAAFITQLEHTPSDPSIYLQLGEISKHQGNLNKAEQHYTNGIKLGEDTIQLQFALAELYERKGNYTDALNLYRGILIKEPANLVAANNLAIIYADELPSTENLSEARDLLERLKRSGHPAIIDTLGWIYYGLGNSDKAIPLLQYAAGKSPANPIFNYHLGMAYARIGKNKLAVKHLETALASKNFSKIEDAEAALSSLTQ